MAGNPLLDCCCSPQKLRIKLDLPEFNIAYDHTYSTGSGTGYGCNGTDSEGALDCDSSLVKSHVFRAYATPTIDFYVEWDAENNKYTVPAAKMMQQVLNPYTSALTDEPDFWRHNEDYVDIRYNGDKEWDQSLTDMEFLKPIMQTDALLNDTHRGGHCGGQFNSTTVDIDGLTSASYSIPSGGGTPWFVASFAPSALCNTYRDNNIDGGGDGSISLCDEALDTNFGFLQDSSVGGIDRKAVQFRHILKTTDSLVSNQEGSSDCVCKTCPCASGAKMARFTITGIVGASTNFYGISEGGLASDYRDWTCSVCCDNTALCTCSNPSPVGAPNQSCCTGKWYGSGSCNEYEYTQNDGTEVAFGCSDLCCCCGVTECSPLGGTEKTNCNGLLDMGFLAPKETLQTCNECSCKPSTAASCADSDANIFGDDNQQFFSPIPAQWMNIASTASALGSSCCGGQFKRWGAIKDLTLDVRYCTGKTSGQIKFFPNDSCSGQISFFKLWIEVPICAQDTDIDPSDPEYRIAVAKVMTAPCCDDPCDDEGRQCWNFCPECQDWDYNGDGDVGCPTSWSCT